MLKAAFILLCLHPHFYKSLRISCLLYQQSVVIRNHLKAQFQTNVCLKHAQIDCYLLSHKSLF